MKYQREGKVGGIAGTFLTLLAQLTVGGMAAMLLVPMVGIGRGFYRTTTGIYLGIAVPALWVRIWLLLHAAAGGAASRAVASSTALPGTLALGASAILTLAFLVSLWGSHSVWSRRLLWGASVAGVAGLGLDAIALGRDGSALVLSALLANAWLSSALLGLTFTGMLLGHWYLNEAGLPTWHVWRMAHWFLVAVLAQGLFPIAHGLVAVMAGDPARAAEVWRVIPEHPILFGGRVLIGGVATLVIALLIRNTLRIPNVQSATGFFYIAILTVLLGELLGRALFLFTGVPF